MNSKLASILNKSRKVMERAEEMKPVNSPNAGVGPMTQTTNQNYNPHMYDNTYDANHYDHNAYNQGLYEQQTYVDPYEQYQQPRGVAAKNLPPEILKLMESHPSTYNPTGTLNPTLDLEMAKYKEQLAMEQNQRQQRPQQINESNDYILVSQSELKKMINETLKNFLTQFKGKIEEATIKKTLSVLLKEQKRG